jgi:hypothetical protein
MAECTVLLDIFTADATSLWIERKGAREVAGMDSRPVSAAMPADARPAQVLMVRTLPLG